MDSPEDTEFEFSSSAPDLKPGQFKGIDPKVDVDAVFGSGQFSKELEKSYLAHTEPPKRDAKYLYFNQVFRLSRKNEAEEFAKLLNDPNKAIVATEKNWAQDGSFNMWVLYTVEQPKTK